MIKLKNHNKNILPPKQFAARVFKYTAFTTLMIGVSLGIGMWGYHHFAQLSWIDSFYNASMILTGMGPANKIDSEAGKIFSSFYALFSGIAFLSSSAIFIAPFAHRLMHMLHIEPNDDEKQQD
ncbi:MAG: hypothetical protein Fur0041_14560 [Bacteroidia bacterium]